MTRKPLRERVDLRIAPDGLALVRRLAEQEQRSLSDMLRVLIMEALAARGELRLGRTTMAKPGELIYGDPCRYCGQDGWPAGSAGNAKAMHEREHEREADRKRRRK